MTAERTTRGGGSDSGRLIADESGSGAVDGGTTPNAH
jgi:hypothetical protein